MLFEEELAELALTNLHAHTGIVGQWLAAASPFDQGVGGEILLNIHGSEIRFKAEVKREFREYHMEKLLDLASRQDPLLLIADRLFPAQKKRLREHQISYLDVAGNTYMRYGELLLWIDGQKGTYSSAETPRISRAFTKAGLKVVYALLENQTAVNYTYRELASYSGVALGTINEAMTALKEAGYLLRANKSRMILNNKKQLLEHWLVGYGNVLKPSLQLGSYQMRDTANWKAATLPTGALWGGEPAGDLATGYLYPEQWTIYTSHSKSEVAKALQLIPKQGGNLKLFKKFWTDVALDTNNTATPDLITYADLLLTGDQRCIETAKIIYEQKLSRVFEN
ncbi:replication/maintenance protein RepL [Dyadobacter sp. CY261]|uniref:type IV toxin-antitoxin system AbiEi family antitoxin n=1 Tax=Dyadobacter sp. CY261 TaxID=2907203 RepID=UPI001F1D47BA|nr:type IV toxin-antitoxin system AbiEi family antitoxin [Dyadobacter sp. CY261]MCF0072176.1 replication/maintenance protein RepL [Dyadobacter sp. CY261]